ncbi:hypothetical protein J8V12_10760 [Photorhabdus thracensis]|nr:hypothetical protein [Photorhabdus thracensis]
MIRGGWFTIASLCERVTFKGNCFTFSIKFPTESCSCAAVGSYIHFVASIIELLIGEKWIYVPEFNRAMREAFYNRPKEQRDAWLLWIGL